MENVSDVSVTASPVEVMEILNQIGEIFKQSKFSKTMSDKSSEPFTINFDDSSEKKSTESIHHVDTDNMIRKLRASCVDQKCEKVNIDIGTEQLIAKLQNGSHNNQNAVSSEPNTDQIIDKIFRTQKGGCGCAQSGGKKKKKQKT